MRRGSGVWLSVAPALCALAVACVPGCSQEAARLAVLDFSGDEGGRYVLLLRRAAGEAAGGGIELVDPELAATAARGAGYSGSLNLSREEARALGRSIGCDYFVLGKVIRTPRIGRQEERYFEALAAVFTVETRTGVLLRFAFISRKSPDEKSAAEGLDAAIVRDWELSANAIGESRRRRATDLADPTTAPPATEFRLEDEQGDAAGPAPQFYNRLKPAYTDQADLAGVTATVELEAVFGADGRVGDVEVVRWAGFGLDESAVATVRSLKFKPAERDGKRLSIRGLVRYNFRRPLTQASRPGAASPEEIDKLRRSIRKIIDPPLKPPVRPEPPPDRNP